MNYHTMKLRMRLYRAVVVFGWVAILAALIGIPTITGVAQGIGNAAIMFLLVALIALFPSMWIVWLTDKAIELWGDVKVEEDLREKEKAREAQKIIRDYERRNQ